MRSAPSSPTRPALASPTSALRGENDLSQVATAALSFAAHSLPSPGAGPSSSTPSSFGQAAAERAARLGGSSRPGLSSLESLKEVFLHPHYPPPHPAFSRLRTVVVWSVRAVVWAVAIVVAVCSYPLRSRRNRFLIPSAFPAKKAVMRSQAPSLKRKSRLQQAMTLGGSPPVPEDSTSPRDPYGVSSFAGQMGSLPSSTKSKFDPTPSSSSTSTTIPSSSYPFPPMRTMSSSSVAAAFQSPGAGPYDKLLPSGTTTPASFAFHPQGGVPISPYQNPDFPSPNMYEMALQLHSEPGVEAFWSNLVKIATTCYKAERITLAVPSDSTDLENTPWGQKATFNVAEDDRRSFSGEGRDRGSGGESSGEDDDQGVRLPREEYALEHSRRSEQHWESDEKRREMEDPDPVAIDSCSEEPFEPVTVGVDTSGYETSNSDWISEVSARSPVDQPPPMPPESRSESQDRGEEGPEVKGRVFETLQPLTQESDALLDGSGVSRVLQRGKTVVLSREYRDVKTHLQQQGKRRKEGSSSRLSSPPKETEDIRTAPFRSGPGSIEMPAPSFPSSEPPTPLLFTVKGGKRKRIPRTENGYGGQGHNPVLQYYSTQQHLHHVQTRSHSPHRACNYEEYEQPITSPWSQSPAPSPAPRPDPNENPFFAQPKVDEDTFNPAAQSPKYNAAEPVNAIGCESSWTVIHIPLVHPSQAHNVQFPEHDDGRDRNMDPRLNSGPKKAPMAILSMLSPVIPYPSNLIHSLSHFAPLVATAFSLAQTHSSVLNQLSHFRTRPARRPRFNQRRTYTDQTILKSPDPGGMDYMTSPSEMSSTLTGSSAASPAWQVGTPSMTSERNSIKSSASQSGTPLSPAVDRDGEGYFPLVRERRGIFSRQSSGNVVTMRTVEQERIASLEARLKRGKRDKLMEEPEPEPEPVDLKQKGPARESQSAPADMTTDSQRTPTAAFSEEKENNGKLELETPSPRKQRRKVKRRRTGARMPHHPHTLLHSYGADYSATFQSLSATTSLPESYRSLSSKLKPHHLHEMPPPSNKLLRTIIDSIPVHVFTAAPETGVTTWVNARMLAYRGLSVEDFLKDPWGGLHPEDREKYMQGWHSAIKKGEAFSIQVRVRRFDGMYRLFMVRAVPLRDHRGIIVHWFGTNMDVHDQKMAEVNAARQAEMATSEQKYRSLANSSPQIVFAATAHEGITFANTQWLEYSGQTQDLSLRLGFMENVHMKDRPKCCLPGLDISYCGVAISGGSEASTLTPGDTRKDEWPKLSRTGDDKPTFSTEMRLMDKHGEYRWHLVRLVSVEPNMENGRGLWFGTCTDINDQKLVEQRLKEANEAAQRTMESKTRFLANMSHEIRTPLIGISGMVNFLLDTPLNGEQLDYCHTISQSSEGLLSVINDILDLSKVEAGMMRLNPEWFRINSLIEDAQELLSTMAIAKELELNYIVDDDVPPMVRGDRVRLRQVMLNVIGNAIKFTNEGEVFSRISVLHDYPVEEHEVMIQFECLDTGPGFDKKDEELMFKPFSQIDGSSTRAHGGSGLGLVISRQLVELHGGWLTAKSVKGSGSTFTATAKFGLPKESDGSPSAVVLSDAHPQRIVRPVKPSETQNRFLALSAGLTKSPGNTPPAFNNGEASEADTQSSIASPASSNPSIQSVPSSGKSTISSTSSYQPPPLSSPQDPASMRLSLPQDAQKKYNEYSPALDVKRSLAKKTSVDSQLGRAVSPPMFSILVVSEPEHSRRAIAHHIRVTLPKNIPNQITTISNFQECQSLLAGEDPVVFTHVAVNLPDHCEIIELIRIVLRRSIHTQTTILSITNPTQRQAIIQGAPEDYDRIAPRLHFIYKPIKPSRFGVVFDPAKERDASTDRNRDSAHQVVETQKKVFSKLENEVGNRGHKVLLVEDNRVNQKVLLRFLAKVGLEVETASDGEEFVEKVFAKDPSYYGLILCDLHMPRKDGFQATAEIREWERQHAAPHMPIVALSANVMSDVSDRCAAAGFTRYVSKPVDFRELSKTIEELLPHDGEKTKITPMMKSDEEMAAGKV